MLFVKLIDGIIEFAPQNNGAIMNYNTNEELMRNDGYKSFIQADRPITDRQYHIEYKETKRDISEVIVYDETQEQADARELNEAKSAKYAENDFKATEKRYNQEFTLNIQEQECVFDTTEQTQTDLLTAFAVCSTGQTYDGWVCNNGIVINIRLEDLFIIQEAFRELSNVYPKWNYYKNLIDSATDVSEVEAIQIDYSIRV